MKFNPIYILCVLLVLVIGCARPPITEMDNAREAVFRASNDANASQFAAGTLERARAALQRMEDEANNKRYDAARTHAMEAISLAERALIEGSMGTDRSKDDAASLITNLRPEIVDTQRNVNGARYSQLNLDYEALDRSIVNAYSMADRAEQSQADGRFQDALDIARNVRSDLSEINRLVAGAAAVRKK